MEQIYRYSAGSCPSLYAAAVTSVMMSMLWTSGHGLQPESWGYLLPFHAPLLYCSPSLPSTNASAQAP